MSTKVTFTKHNGGLKTKILLTTLVTGKFGKKLPIATKYQKDHKNGMKKRSTTLETKSQ